MGGIFECYGLILQILQIGRIFLLKLRILVKQSVFQSFKNDLNDHLKSLFEIPTV